MPEIGFAGKSIVPQSQDWCTPPKYVKAVRKFFDGRIDLDPCSNPQSIVNATTEFSLPDKDGLKEEWNFEHIFVNPPYGADRVRHTTIRNWLAKCSEAHGKYHSQVLALVPVSPNTRHWKEHVFGSADAICFLEDTRLKFLVNGNTDNKGAPMACCMVYWGNEVGKFTEEFSQYGAVVDIRTLK